MRLTNLSAAADRLAATAERVDVPIMPVASRGMVPVGGAVILGRAQEAARRAGVRRSIGAARSRDGRTGAGSRPPP
jgi:hypothetical protein